MFIRRSNKIRVHVVGCCLLQWHCNTKKCFDWPIRCSMSVCVCFDFLNIYRSMIECNSDGGWLGFFPEIWPTGARWQHCFGGEMCGVLWTCRHSINIVACARIAFLANLKTFSRQQWRATAATATTNRVNEEKKNERKLQTQAKASRVTTHKVHAIFSVSGEKIANEINEPTSILIQWQWPRWMMYIVRKKQHARTRTLHTLHAVAISRFLAKYAPTTKDGLGWFR